MDWERTGPGLGLGLGLGYVRLGAVSLVVWWGGGGAPVEVRIPVYTYFFLFTPFSLCLEMTEPRPQDWMGGAPCL